MKDINRISLFQVESVAPELIRLLLPGGSCHAVQPDSPAVQPPSTQPWRASARRDSYCEAWRGVAWQTIERDPTNADEWHIYVGEARRVTVARRVVSNNTVHFSTLTQA